MNAIDHAKSVLAMHGRNMGRDASDAMFMLIRCAERLQQGVQRTREDTGWCPVCDEHHSEPTEECP